MLFNRLVVEKDETQTAPFATGSGNTTLFYTPHSLTPSQMHSREQFEIPDLGKMIFNLKLHFQFVVELSILEIYQSYV